MSQNTLSPKQAGTTLAMALAAGLLAGGALAAVTSHDPMAHGSGAGFDIAMILEFCGFGPEEDDAMPNM